MPRTVLVLQDHAGVCLNSLASQSASIVPHECSVSAAHMLTRYFQSQLIGLQLITCPAYSGCWLLHVSWQAL